MTRWIRFEVEGREAFGVLDGQTVTEYAGDMFAAPQPTTCRHALSALRLLTPCRPGKMIGLWNNFAERARVEGFSRPAHPLYFLKAGNSFAADGSHIRRPAG